MHLPSTFRPSVLQPHSEPQYYNPLPVDPVIHASMKGRSVGACRSLPRLPSRIRPTPFPVTPLPPAPRRGRGGGACPSLAPLPAEALSYGHASPPQPADHPGTPPLFRGRGARVPPRRAPVRGGGGGAAGE